MLDPELRLEADFNPLISPPPELLKGGLLQVQEYLRVRMVRQRELCDLVTELDFEYIMDRTHPGTPTHGKLTTHPSTHSPFRLPLSILCNPLRNLQDLNVAARYISVPNATPVPAVTTCF